MNEIISMSELGITFDNGVKALEKVNLVFYEGEFVSIVGSSGCGKSTLLRLIAGLIVDCVDGQISVADISPLMARKKKQQLAFVFQESNLLPWRNTLQNVELPLELRGVESEIRHAKSVAALNLVGLQNFHLSFPRQLSGGMKMRVSLARALITEPKIMLLDEPFSALDEITRQRLNEELLDIWQAEKWTTLFVTHNIFEAIFLSTRIIVMGGTPGRVIADLKIPFVYPRKPDIRTSVDFVKLAAKVGSLLRQEI